MVVLSIIAVAAFLLFFFYCPCARVPGGWLLGKEVDAQITDWSFANAVPLCQIQVGGGLPHSVNLNCMASQQRLFLSCARCAGKIWSSRALTNPAARIRIGSSVYPVLLHRIENSALLDQAWRARAEKIGRRYSAMRPRHWWSFEVTSRKMGSG